MIPDPSLVPPEVQQPGYSGPCVADQNLMQDGLKYRMQGSYYPPHYVRFLWGKWILIWVIFTELCLVAAFIANSLEDIAYHESITAEQNRQADSLRVLRNRGRK